MLEDKDAVGRMAGWLGRNLANRASIFTRSGATGVQPQYERQPRNSPCPTKIAALVAHKRTRAPCGTRVSKTNRST